MGQMDQVCFNVNEMLCSLKQKTDYDAVQEKYQVQKCTTIMDRVCDTNYNLDVVTEDDYQCIDLAGHYCEDIEVAVQDVVCKYTFKFDCKKPKRGEGGYGMEKVCTKEPEESATRRPGRSESLCASRRQTVTVRSSPTLLCFQWRSRTVTSRRRISASLRRSSGQGRRSGTATTRNARRFPGRSAIWWRGKESPPTVSRSIVLSASSFLSSRVLALLQSSIATSRSGSPWRRSATRSWGSSSCKQNILIFNKIS